MIETKWYARGGQGGFTACRLLGLAAIFHGGKYAQAFPSFGPERRGAPVFGFTRIDDKPIQDHSQVYNCDYAIVLDNTLLDTLDVTQGIKPGGTLFINTPHEPEYFGFEGDFGVVTYDALELAKRIIGRPITNTAMMTVLAAYTGLVDKESIVQAVRQSMHGSAVEKNVALIEEVYAQVAQMAAQGKGEAHE